MRLICMLLACVLSISVGCKQKTTDKGRQEHKRHCDFVLERMEAARQRLVEAEKSGDKLEIQRCFDVYSSIRKEYLESRCTR